ncbi:MAG: 5-carboxymethyl-2-hydroxymuconate Delta-isomerase, partial [Pseudomonadota bacterium]|nr:5-carboxymethyl-2-hydroxymuconate Delta-isomerase [Pseudomonadota bacterium]
MPHLTIDYSPNLSTDGDVAGLCGRLAACLVEQRAADGTVVYPIGGIRVRAFAADAWCIADGAVDAAYLHAALQVGAGRSEATLRATGDALFEVMKTHFAELYQRMGLALSLEIGEFSEAGTWKHNNL